MTDLLQQLALWLCGFPEVDRLSRVEEWQWYSASQPAIWIIWVIGAVSVAMAVLTILPRSGLPIRTAIFLSFLRLLAGALIILLFAQVELRVRMNLDLPPKVAVLTDRSGSMGVMDLENDRSRLASAEAFRENLVNTLEGDAHLLFHDFSWKLFPDGNDTARGGTDFGRTLRSLSRDEPDLQAVVLLTDGNEPSTQSGWAEAAPLLAAQEMKVFPVAFGRAEKPEVLGTRLDGEYFVRLGDELQMQTKLDASAFEKDLVAQLKLFQMKPPKPGPPSPDAPPPEWLMVKEQKVQLGGGRISLIPITFKPKVVGRHKFRVVIEGVKGQASEKLLESEHTVDVIDRNIRVLYIDVPRDERKILGHWIARDPIIDMGGLVKLPKEGWYAMGQMRHKNLGKALPDLEAELHDYDVVILGDVARGDFRGGGSDETSMAWLADFVMQRGGGLITLGGRNVYSAGNYQDSALGVLLPFEVPRMDETQVTGKFNVIPTPVGYSHPGLRLEPDPEGNKRAWLELPKVEGCNRVGDLKPGSQMLATVETEEGSLPSMAYQKIGRGNVLALTIDTTWRWEFQRPRGSEADGVAEGTDYFRRFWGNAIRMVAPDPRLQPERPQIDRREKRAEVGQSVNLKTRLVDKVFNPIRNADLVARITSPGGKEIALYPADSQSNPGIYEYKFEIDEAGLWEVRTIHKEKEVLAAIAKAKTDLEKAEARAKEDLSVEASGKEPFYVTDAKRKLLDQEARIAKESILAIDSVSEFVDTRTQPEAMASLAASTGGKAFDSSKIESLVESLASLSRNVSKSYVSPLWNLPATMILFILLVCIDCWLRKRRGCA
mgnify:FL=1